MKEHDQEPFPAWGKTVVEDDTFHHLAHHCADVAACFLALVRLPIWRQRLEKAAGAALSEQLLERLAVLTFLHDVGKLLPAFQCRGWSETRKQALGKQLYRCREGKGHAQEGACLFLAEDAGSRPPLWELLQVLQLQDIAGWGDVEVLRALLLASFSHHGRRINLQECAATQDAAILWKPLGSYDPLVQARQLGRCMKRWFPRAFAQGGKPLPGRPVFQHFFAGLVALADWVGSDTTFFPYVPELDEDYFHKAMRRAEQALRVIGLDTSDQRTASVSPARFEQLLPDATPNAVQQAMGDVSVDARLLILEAQTGSGKTEAALWRFLKLHEAGQVDGMYFALPTRSAAVQLHGRVHEAMRRVFGNVAPQTVLAVPGYYRAGDHEGAPLPHWRVLWDDDGQASNEELARRWAAEHSKRYLAAQVAVGTVDQAMLAALAVKHAHLRGSALARSLLVIDEVHASDVYMTRIQQQLVEDHLAIGGHVLAMSATLGASVRCKWLGRQVPSFGEAVATPYPAIWTREEEDPRAPANDSRGADKRIGMKSLSGMDAELVTARAIEAARAGAKVLVVRNTVKGAMEAFHAVERALGNDEQHLLFSVNDRATLHHSRFAAEDRRLLDARVETLLGKNGQRPRHGLIVIGTQTLEQSLDICADYLITDLCPADVLLQRLGRLHRHDNDRPTGYEQPQCLVLIPEGGLEACLTRMIHGLGSWRNHDGTLSGIYVDVVALELTRRLIAEHGTWEIPAMNRLLVEGITHPEPREALLNELGGAWQEYDSKLQAELIGEKLFASMQVLRRDAPFTDVSTADEEKVRTRLGEDGMPIDFPGGTIGPFGESISRITIPAHFLGREPPEVPVEVTRRDKESLQIQTGKCSFVYNRLGLRTAPHLQALDT